MKLKLVVLVSAAPVLLLVVILVRTTSETPVSHRARLQRSAPDASARPKVPPKAPSFTNTGAETVDEVVRNAERALSGPVKDYTPPRQERLRFAILGTESEFQAAETALQQMSLPEEQLNRLRKLASSERQVIVELIEKYIDHPDQRTIDGGPPAELRRDYVYEVLQRELGDRYAEFRTAQAREQQRLSRLTRTEGFLRGGPPN